MVTLDVYPVHAVTAIERVLDQEVVLVFPGRGQVKVLNEVAARIWNLADGGHTVKQIIQVICSEYRVEEIQAEQDVREFLDALMERGLIIVLNEASLPSTS